LDDEAILRIATLPLVARNDKSVGAWNFKSWHKIFAAEKARSKTFTMFQTAWNV